MSLTVQLKVLQESIEYYEKLIQTIKEQTEALWAEKDSLFEVWRGIHADSCNEKLCGILAGGIGAQASENTASLRQVQEQAEYMLNSLQEARERFQAEKTRCEEEFYAALSSDTTYVTSPGKGAEFQTELYIDYAAMNILVQKVSDLMDGGCDVEGNKQSQLGRWNVLLDTFGGSMDQDSYHPGDSDYQVRTILKKEHNRLNNFYMALYLYHNNLKEAEELLMEEFGKQTEASAKGITREIYEVYMTGEINVQRIWYLNQKSPEELTPSEMSEIYRMLKYIMERPEEKLKTDMELLGKGRIGWLDVEDPKENALYDLFRSYSAALNTTYMNDVSKYGEKKLVSDYFEKETLKRLTSGDEARNYDFLNRLMEQTPDGITTGDLKALTAMFDKTVVDTGKESMEQFNLFLAHCYIDGEANPGGMMDAVRSPIFEQWALHYLEKNPTTEEDFEILNGREDPKAANVKFLKQALLNVAMSNTAMEVQIRGEFDPKTGGWEQNRGIFLVDGLNTGKNGDYKLSLYQSYQKSGDCIEIEYYEYRNSRGMGTMLDGDMVWKFRDSKKDFLEYAKDQGRDLLFGMTFGKVIDGTKTAATAIVGAPAGYAVDIAVEATKFGMGWNQQTGENAAIDAALKKYWDGLEMEAFQQSGQVMYVNGIRIVNNEKVDLKRQEELLRGFQKRINPETNEYFEEFFPKDCDKDTRTAIENGLNNLDSVVYKNAFVNWYHNGKGDSGSKIGENYKEGTN